MLLQFGLLLALLSVCSLAPGFYLVRKLSWNPMEKLCGGIGLSLILVYLAAWGVYCFGAGRQAPAFAVVSIACLMLGVLARKDWFQLFRAQRVRQASLGFGFLLVWTLVILGMIRHYSGLGWGSDWLEHFQRSLFFLRRFPLDTPFIFGYQLPARPPMMNVLAAFFLAQTEDLFSFFQVIFTFLNLLLFLPCWLMMPALGLSRRARILPLTALFAVNPIVIENATYAWTKSLAVFFVVLALWFYLAGWRKNDWVRMIAAFVFLAAGALVHYSAGPYCVFLGAHYLLLVFWKRRARWRELAAIAVVCTALLGTWFGWSIAKFGTHTTFKSNTSVTSAQKYEGSSAVRIARNIADSIVPYVVRGRLHTDQPNVAGRVRDYAFTFFQLNLIFGMGLVGGPLAVWLLYRLRGKRPEWRFWRLAIPVCCILGIAVVGERDVFGSAHLTLIPLMVLGVSLVAAAYPWKRVVAIAVLAGCVVDFGLGVFLQAKIEALENTAEKTVFTAAVRPADGGYQRGSWTREGLSVTAWENWFQKHRFAQYREMLGQLADFHPPDAASQQAVVRVRTRLQNDLRDDERYWHGWFERHQYRLRFFGDEIAETGSLLPALLCVLFLGLMGAMGRELWMPRVKAVPVKTRGAARGSRR